MDKKSLKIIFFGTPEFSVESLKALYGEGYSIRAIVTMPDKPAGRGHKLYQSPVKEFGVEHGITVLQPKSLKDPAFITTLREINADLFIVIAFRMLPEIVWGMPPLGTFNLHASLLPRYRGAAPINWAIINGDTQTGVTTFFLKHDIDTGDIIDQQEVAILPEDNAGSLHDKLMSIGAKLTLKTVENILLGKISPIPQSELIGESPQLHAPKIFKDTCKIDWSLPSEKVRNFIRGLSPYPGAWTTFKTIDNHSFDVKIFDATQTDQKSESPGKINITKKGLFIDCADYRLQIISLQPQGKKRLTSQEYIIGLRVPLDNAI